MKIAVVVASVNRPEEIGQLLCRLARQSVLPSSITLSVETLSDLPATLEPNIAVIMGPRSLTAQRNRGLDLVVPSSDLVVFLDDDFLPHDSAIEQIQCLFSENPQIVGATGLVIADGVKRGGLTYEAARQYLETFTCAEKIVNMATDELYGCNMVFRSSAVRDIRFDEKLPLYAWQEDVDFAGQLLKMGHLVKTTAFAGVHRGVTKGRSPGIALGFSQMVNPVYLVTKGTMRPGKAAKLMFKNFVANHIRAVMPETFIDRVGRSRGNWLGLWHLMSGSADPGAILRLR